MDSKNDGEELFTLGQGASKIIERFGKSKHALKDH